MIGRQRKQAPKLASIPHSDTQERALPPYQAEAGAGSVSYGVGLRTVYRRKAIVIGMIIFLVLWEVIAKIIEQTASHPDRVFPTIEYIIQVSAPELSHYWSGGLGIEPPEEGGQTSYWLAALTVIWNSAITIFRVSLGLVVAIIGGVGIGLLVGWSEKLRLMVLGTGNFLRMMPLLAMVPLFTLWFGASLFGVAMFIGFSVGSILLVATINAIQNVPGRFKEYAATLGSSQFDVYRSVVAPAILPELRSAMFVALGLAWSVAIAAEFLGVQSGLGRMMELALRFSQIGRMVLIAIVFVFIAIVSFRLLDWFADKITRWAD